MDDLVNPDAARLARDRGLGDAAEVHTAQTRYSWVTLLIAVIVGLVTAVGAVVGFQADSIVGGVTSGLMALGFLGYAAWKVSAMRATGVEQVYLFAGGLVYTARNRTEVMAWPEITLVWRWSADVRAASGRLVRRERRLTLVNDGAPILLSERFSGIEDITRSLDRAVIPIQLGRARDQLAAGQPVNFPHAYLDDLVVDAQAVTQGGTRIPLDDIRTVEIEDGSLVIEGQHQTLKVSSGALANLPVLVRLLGVAPFGASN